MYALGRGRQLAPARSWSLPTKMSTKDFLPCVGVYNAVTLASLTYEIVGKSNHKHKYILNELHPSASRQECKSACEKANSKILESSRKYITTFYVQYAEKPVDCRGLAKQTVHCKLFSPLKVLQRIKCLLHGNRTFRKPWRALRDLDNFPTAARQSQVTT